MDREILRQNQYRVGECALLKQEADSVRAKALVQLTEALKAMQAVKLAVEVNDEKAGDREDLKLGNVQKFAQVLRLQDYLTAWATNQGISEVLIGIGVWSSKKRA